MTDRLRWMKFWPADWSRDPALRMCGLAARGLWIEMIGLMHEAEPYGHLLVNGRPVSPKQLAAVVGTTEREVAKLLAELEISGVFSRTDAGVIFSRRMLRDFAKAEEGREAIARRWGKKGGPGTDSDPPNTPPNRPPTKPVDRGASSLEAEAEAEAERTPIVPRRGTGASSLDAFEAWWVEYPRKVGKDAAKRAYAAAQRRGASDADLLTGLRRQRWSSDPKFIPHASTWLSGGRWQDDPDAAAPARTGGGEPWWMTEMRNDLPPEAA